MRIGQAGLPRAVVACQQPKGFNLGLSQNHLPLLVLQPQEVVVMIHSGALNSCLLEEERGNNLYTCLARRFACVRSQNSLVYFYQGRDCNGCVACCSVYSYPLSGSLACKRSVNPLSVEDGDSSSISLRGICHSKASELIHKREESFRGRNCLYI